MLTVIAAISFALPQTAATATTCAPATARELARFGDVSATGMVNAVFPLGFILSVDRVYTGDMPAHVVVFGQYDPGSPNTRHYVVLRSRLPGIYTMGECDGRPMSVESSLGALGAAHPPSPDLPAAQAAAIAGVLLALVLIRRRRGSGSPPAATATAY